MGAVLWAPPPFIGERLRVIRQGAVSLAVSLLGGGVVVGAGAALLAGAGLEAGWWLTGPAFLLVLASLWPWATARKASTVWFAVFERAVLMPSSFTSVPGLANLKGPCTLPRSQIQYAKQLREPGGRAVILMAGEGMGGVVASRVGPVELTTEEQEQVLDSFIEALRGLGVRFKAETIAQGPDLESPDA